MKINKDINSGTKAWTLIGIIMVSIIVIYTIVWYRIASIYKEKIANFLDQKTTYSTIKMSGYPFSIKTNIRDLKIKYMGSDIGIDNLTFKSMLLSKKIYLNVFYAHVSSNSNFEQEIFFSDEQNIKLILGNNSIEKVDANVKEIIVKDLSDKSKENIVKNMIYKMDVASNSEINNVALYLDIPSILLGTRDGDQFTVLNENNFHVSLSLITDMYKSVPTSLSLNIDNINFNNLTNKLSININGNYKKNFQTRIESANIETKVDNLENFINSYKNETNEIYINYLVKLLEILPTNSKNTDKEKYYILDKKEVDSSFKLNGKDVNNLITELMPIIEQLNSNMSNQ